MRLSLPGCRLRGQDHRFSAQPATQRLLGQAFFRKAICSQGRSPENMTLDGYAGSHRAVRELEQQGRLADLTELRSSKYLNNLANRTIVTLSPGWVLCQV